MTMTKMKRSEVEKLLESWGVERVGFSRVQNGKVVELVSTPRSPASNGGLIDNTKRLTGWRHYKF